MTGSVPGNACFVLVLLLLLIRSSQPFLPRPSASDLCRPKRGEGTLGTEAYCCTSNANAIRFWKSTPASIPHAHTMYFISFSTSRLLPYRQTFYSGSKLFTRLIHAFPLNTDSNDIKPIIIGYFTPRKVVSIRLQHDHIYKGDPVLFTYHQNTSGSMTGTTQQLVQHDNRNMTNAGLFFRTRGISCVYRDRFQVGQAPGADYARK
jgi:hypothetical protein